MKANKIITRLKKVDISVCGITLLSIEEYEKNEDIIPSVNQWWWLRSPGYYQDMAEYVDYDGLLAWRCVGDVRGCIRPALTICNLKSSNLVSGAKIELAGYMWTVLRGDMLLCDECVGKTRFRRGWKADDANDYDKSDIKQWLFRWAEENGIAFSYATKCTGAKRRKRWRWRNKNDLCYK